MSGLQEYLIEKRAAVRAQRARVERGETPPKRVIARAAADDRSGVRRIAIRGHHLLADSGAETGGFDLGPSPVELLLGALAGCLTHTFMVQAAARGIALDAIATTVSATSDPRAGHPAHPDVPIHPTDIAFTIDVTSQAPREELDAVYAAVERVCPVTALLTQPQPVRGELVHTSSTPAAALAGVR